jgi:hypothetical protein
MCDRVITDWGWNAVMLLDSSYVHLEDCSRGEGGCVETLGWWAHIFGHSAPITPNYMFVGTGN